MKKLLYIILLLAELFVDVLLMIALCSSSLYIPVAVAAAAVIGILTWQLVRLSKTEDAAAKRRTLVIIAATMLIPCAVFAITYVAVAIALIIAFV